MPKINFAFSQVYQTLFDGLLTSVSSWRARGNTDSFLTCCWTACGDKFKPGIGLLVLGRATNGYDNSFTASDMADPDKRALVIEAARKVAEAPQGRAPLYWVNDRVAEAAPKPGHKRRTGGTVGSHSAFWRIARALLSEVTPASQADPNWASYIAWGNLAKIAPNVAVNTVSEGANPCGSLAEVQQKACIELLRQEVAELNPRVVLVIAGWWWTDAHMEGLGLTLVTVPGAVHAKRVAVEPNGRRWIITDRPEHKAQAPFVTEVSAALAYSVRLAS